MNRKTFHRRTLALFVSRYLNKNFTCKLKTQSFMINFFKTTIFSKYIKSLKWYKLKALSHFLDKANKGYLSR